MEDKLSKSYIERIEIKGLWGRYDVDWTLHPDVNILVGENGTGKSTVLLILHAILDIGLLVQKNIGSKSINYSLKIGGESQKFECRVSKKMFSTGDSGFGYIPMGYSSPKNFFNVVSIEYISTFDKNLFEKNDWDKKNKPYILTHLDKELDEIIGNYLDYQLNQTKKIINGKQNVEAVFAKRKYLIETINRLLKNTKKRVDENENRIAFLLEDGQKISSFDLSSGEKQLLIILLTVLCQDEKSSILLLDEPEISMHLLWQYELIEIIRTLNPNCQVIIVTHSPSIFTDGWHNRVFWMEDICKPTSKLENAYQTA